jgi:predicted enzyme related to lactoylglutathione lyase
MTDHHGIVHFELPADDPEKLSKFYTDLFGWNITKYPMGDFNYWSVASGPTDQQGMPQEPGFINGGITKRMAPDQRTVNYTNVESVDDYVKKATGLGAKVVVEKMPVPGMGWFAQLFDPEGNVFGVWQNDPSAG